MAEAEQEKRGRGRPAGALSKGSRRQSKLKNTILTPLEPYAVEALETILKVMRNEGAAPAVRLQASKFVIDKIGDLINEVYGKEKDQTEEDVPDKDEAPTGAILSFQVINNDKK